MNKLNVIFFFLLAISFLVAAPGVFAAQTAQNGKVVVLGKTETVDGDYLAAGGDSVTVSGTVNGDVYVVGGTVIIDGTVNGDVLAAGGTVTVNGAVKNNVRAAGGTITVVGVVDKNVTLVGGTINVANSAKLGGNVVVAGGTTEIFAPVPKGVTVAVGQLTLANTVGSNVLAAASRLHLTSQANVKGDLNYVSEQKADIQPGATVSGKIIQTVPPQPVQEVKTTGVDRVFHIIRAAFTAVSFISILVLGLLFLWLIPGFMQKTANTITKRPFASFGVGFAVLFLTPFLLFFLFLTIFGIPFSLILFAGYMIVLYISTIFTSLAVGQRVILMINKKANQVVTFIVGLILLTVLTSLPFFGWLIGFVAMVVGIGGYLIEKRNAYLSLRKSAAI